MTNQIKKGLISLTYRPTLTGGFFIFQNKLNISCFSRMVFLDLHNKQKQQDYALH